jgi:TonB family protein
MKRPYVNPTNRILAGLLISLTLHAGVIAGLGIFQGQEEEVSRSYEPLVVELAAVLPSALEPESTPAAEPPPPAAVESPAVEPTAVPERRPAETVSRPAPQEAPAPAREAPERTGAPAAVAPAAVAPATDEPGPVVPAEGELEQEEGDSPFRFGELSETTEVARTPENELEYFDTTTEGPAGPGPVNEEKREEPRLDLSRFDEVSSQEGEGGVSGETTVGPAANGSGIIDLTVTESPAGTTVEGPSNRKPERVVSPDLPDLQGRDLSVLEIELEFEVDADGKVLNPVITKDSGESDVDASILTALRSWSFPPLSPGARESTDQTVRGRIRYIIRVK